MAQAFKVLRTDTLNKGVLRLSVEATQGTLTRSLLDGPDNLKDKVEQLVIQTVNSRAVIDMLVQQILPLVQTNDREEKTEESTEDNSLNNSCHSVVLDGIPSVINVPLSHSTLNSSVIVHEEESNPPSIGNSQLNEQPIINDQEQVLEEEQAEQSEQSEQEEQENEDEESEDSEDELETVSEVVNEVVNNTMSPFKAFLSMVKSVVTKRQDNNERNNEKEEDISNLEEKLEQLKEMGFGDRDANLKLLKFHNRFQEGLDSVVEDLLIQKSQEVTEAPQEVTVQN